MAGDGYEREVQLKYLFYLSEIRATRAGLKLEPKLVPRGDPGRNQNDLSDQRQLRIFTKGTGIGCGSLT